MDEAITLEYRRGLGVMGSMALARAVSNGGRSGPVPLGHKLIWDGVEKRIELEATPLWRVQGHLQERDKN